MADTVVNQPYQYQDLCHPDSIRVLELIPGTPGTALECKLLEVRKSESPRFEALSYTWGAPVFPKRITEIEFANFLQITENLFDALQALRLHDSSRVLWIDAVCINQENTTEKNHQVAQMGDIYRDAERVLVWLGNEDCGNGVDELERIGRDCELYGFSKIFPFPLRMRDHSAAEHLTKLVETCDGAAVNAFLDREWFERVWIVQEFILANDLILVSGSRSITYDLFSKAMCTLRLMLRRPILLRQIRTRDSLWTALMNSKLEKTWALIQKRERYIVLNAQGSKTNSSLPITWPLADPASTITENDNYDKDAVQKGASPATAGLSEHTPELDETIHRSTLVEYCVGAANLKCTNERDRLYGLLGFAGETLSIQPNYDSSPEDVWKDLAIKSLLAGDLTVLHWARGAPTDGTFRGLSFVADLGNLDTGVPRLGGYGTPKFQAGSQVAVQVGQFLQSLLPKLRGVIVDEVKNEGFLGVQNPTATVGEDTAASGSSTVSGHSRSQEQSPVRITKEALVQVWELCRSWVSSNPCQYAEGLTAAFARTILADNALSSTQQLIGDEKVTAVLYFFLEVLSMELPQAEGRLFVPDVLVAEGLGKPYSLGLRMFDSDEPTMYHFPLIGDPDLILTDPNNKTTQTLVEITEPLKTRLEDYETAVSLLLSTRSIFSTAKGYIGLGPKGIAQEDEVVIFGGAQTPFVLRRVGAFATDAPNPLHPQKSYPIYHVVGECYLHGWMHGEAMNKECGLEPQGIILL